MIYSIVSALCIIALALLFADTVIRIFRKKGAERIYAIRDFKKGKCIVVYLPAIPLYWMGFVYAGERLLPSFFDALNTAASLVVLRYETEDIALLLSQNLVYSIAIYSCFVLVILNAMMFTLSLLYQRAWLWFKNRAWMRAHATKILILGNNKDNVNIYRSAASSPKMIVDDISDKDGGELFAKKILFFSTKKPILACVKRIDAFLKRFQKEDTLVENAEKEKLFVIIHTQDDEKNIRYCQDLISWIGIQSARWPKEDRAHKSPYYSQVQIYVFGTPTHEDIYNALVESSCGVVRYINKYRQIAMDFVNRYPITRFMDGDQLDTKTSTVCADVDLNVVMIGFGKVNKQIFLTSVANNQFITSVDGKLESKPVNYHIFDYNHVSNNKNLNHSYYRYQNEIRNVSAEDYLPLPPMPSKESYYDLDINDVGFYQTLKGIVSTCENGLNYVVISFGSDLENIDLAQKILQKKQEWGVKKLYVFVKVRGGIYSLPIFAREDCYAIGNDSKCVYHIDAINDDNITRMAKMRNRVYALEYERRNHRDKAYTKEEIARIYREADYEWYAAKTQFERESNLYACLSLRSKLHMMGLDYVAASNDSEDACLDEDAYMAVYAKDDMPLPLGDMEIDGKRLIDYDKSDFPQSRRQSMAIHEHYRWNAFMISKGFVPATKKEIWDDKRKNGKDYTLRQHGNLTTFDGLVAFRKMLAKRDGVDERVKDVIPYDYQLMDDAFWLLTENGFCIVPKATAAMRDSHT